MTQEDKKLLLTDLCARLSYAHIPASERIDWLNKNHFDYRGLIPKNLRLQ